MANYEYDIDRSINELLPPNKRGSINSVFLGSLFAAIKYVYQWFFSFFYTGAEDVPQYVNGAMYDINEPVLYQKKVYVSMLNNNTALPTDGLSWNLIQNNFIGCSKRILFNGNKLTLEYALNLYFGGVFRQPVSADGSTDIHSDIYILPLAPTPYGFLVANSVGSTVGQNISSDFVGYPYPFIYNVAFSINVPNSILLTLADDTATQKAVIADFAKKLVPASINFTILAY